MNNVIPGNVLLFNHSQNWERILHFDSGLIMLKRNSTVAHLEERWPPMREIGVRALIT